jgi:hypothetical protein
MLRQHFEWVELQTPFRFILVGLMNMIMVCSLATTFFDRHNAIAHHWLQSLLLLSNGPELALHRHDREFKKTCINFIPCSARTISSFCQTIIFFGAIWYVCDGEHFVLKIHKLLLLFDLQNVVVTMVSMNQCISILFERCQFKSLWKLMIGVLTLSTTNNYNTCI